MPTLAPAARGPNAGLIGVPGGRRRLATPALILDLDALDRNLAAIAAIAAGGFALRPHAKTHKSPEIARLQIAAGAVGVSCANIRETEVMAAAGVPGVLLTSPLADPDKIARLAAANARADGLMAVIDHPDSAMALAAAARQAGRELAVLVDLDIGMGRAGVPDAEAAVALARLAAATPGLAYCGVQGYSGRVQHIDSYLGRLQAYGPQLDRFAATVERLRHEGLAPRIVSGGGTGTLAIDRARGLLTEHQAGSFVFMDVEYHRVQQQPQAMTPFETALFVQCQVISAHARTHATIDGGYKCFAADGPLPELASGAPPGATYAWFGDEHGAVRYGDTNDQLAPGARVELVTPHCDPTVNLHDWYHCVRGDRLVDIWPVAARGVL